MVLILGGGGSNNNKTGGFKCNMPPWRDFVMPRILAIVAGISSLSFAQVSARQLGVSSLYKRISSTLNFHKSIGTDGTQTGNLLLCTQALFQLS